MAVDERLIVQSLGEGVTSRATANNGVAEPDGGKSATIVELRSWLIAAWFSTLRYRYPLD